MQKLLIPISLFALVAQAGAQVDAARVVATVNGEEIKGAEYYRFMEYMDLKDAYNRFRNLVFGLPCGYLAIDQMITNKLMLQMAKERGSSPTEPEISAELQNYLAENGAAVLDWKNKGRTDAELRDRVRYDLAVFKLQTQGITVTDGEIDKHYKDYPEEFKTSKLYKLKVIVSVDAATKDKVDAELKAGKPFAEVARTYSDDISKVSGGDYGAVAMGAMPQVIADAIKVARIGQTTNWVVFQEKNLKFLLEDVTPEKLKPLDPVLRKSIRRQMMLDRGRVKNDVGRQLSAFRVKSKVDIKQKEFADVYAKLMQIQISTDKGTPGGGG